MERSRDVNAASCADILRARNVNLIARTFSSPSLMRNESKPLSSSQSYCSCGQSSSNSFSEFSFSNAEDTLETQARASLSLFGFGSSNDSCINWKPLCINTNEVKLNAGNKSQIISLRERTCSLGKNAFYWKLLSKSKNMVEEGEHGNDEDEEGDGEDEQETDEGKPKSKLVQQYLVKSTMIIPATVEELVHLIIKSDPTDMFITMQYLVGVKVNAAEMLYCRNDKRLRYPLPTRSFPRQESTDASTTGSYDSEGDGIEDGKHVPLDSDLKKQPSHLKLQNRASERIQQRWKLLRESSSRLMQESDAICGNHANLSVKRVVAEKPGRMFMTRVQYNLLDYDCIVVNDWDAEDDCGPMFVRVMQSTYLPQCQSKAGQADGIVKVADLQPTGIMVREAKGRPGFVEVQFVGSILEKVDFPVSFRRARLRALCLKIAKLEEIIRSRHLSESLKIQQQPLWVRNTERTCCHSCDAKFSISRRRHHCRLCGDICCSECCPKVEVDLPDTGSTNVRICVLCMKRRSKTDSGDRFITSPSKDQNEAIPSYLAYKMQYSYPQAVMSEAYA